MGEKPDQGRKEDMQLDDSKPASTSATAEGLPQELQGAIGKQLKQVYGQLLAEPLPDKFSELLDSLSKAGNKE